MVHLRCNFDQALTFARILCRPYVRSFGLRFPRFTILQRVEFSIFLLIFACASQQRGAMRCLWCRNAVIILLLLFHRVYEKFQVIPYLGHSPHTCYCSVSSRNAFTPQWIELTQHRQPLGEGRADAKGVTGLLPTVRRTVLCRRKRSGYTTA